MTFLYMYLKQRKSEINMSAVSFLFLKAEVIAIVYRTVYFSFNMKFISFCLLSSRSFRDLQLHTCIVGNQQLKLSYTCLSAFQKGFQTYFEYSDYYKSDNREINQCTCLSKGLSVHWLSEVPLETSFKDARISKLGEHFEKRKALCLALDYWLNVLHKLNNYKQKKKFV